MNKDIFQIESDAVGRLTAEQLKKALDKAFGKHGVAFKVTRLKSGAHTLNGLRHG